MATLPAYDEYGFLSRMRARLNPVREPDSHTSDGHQRVETPPPSYISSVDIIKQNKTFLRMAYCHISSTKKGPGFSTPYHSAPGLRPYALFTPEIAFRENPDVQPNSDEFNFLRSCRKIEAIALFSAELNSECNSDAIVKHHYSALKDFLQYPLLSVTYRIGSFKLPIVALKTHLFTAHIPLAGSPRNRSPQTELLGCNFEHCPFRCCPDPSVQAAQHDYSQRELVRQHINYLCQSLEDCPHYEDDYFISVCSHANSQAIRCIEDTPREIILYHAPRTYSLMFE